MQVDGDVITALLKLFIDAFSEGSARLTPYAIWLLLMLTIIELGLLGLQIAVKGPYAMAEGMIGLGMKVAFYLFLVLSWPLLTRSLVRLLIFFGLASAGGIISESDFTDPSMIAWIGLGQGIRVMNRLIQYIGWDALFNLVDIVLSTLAVCACFYGFIRYALEVAVSLLEFYLGAGVAVILVPFGMTRTTAFLAEKTFAHVWAGGVKLLFLAFLTGASLVIMRGFPALQSGLNPNLPTAITFALAGCTIAFLATRCSRMVNGFAHGSPSLSGHDVVSSVRSTVQTVISVAHLASSAARAGGSAGRGSGTGPSRSPRSVTGGGQGPQHSAPPRPAASQTSGGPSPSPVASPPRPPLQQGGMIS